MVLELWKKGKPRILSSFTATECLYGGLLQSASEGKRGKEGSRMLTSTEWLPSSKRKHEGEGIMGQKGYDNRLLQKEMAQRIISEGQCAISPAG